MKIRRKIFFSFGFLSLFILLILGSVVYFYTSQTVNKMIRNNISDIQKLTIEMLESSYELTLQELKKDIGHAYGYFEKNNELDKKNRVEFNAENQISKEKKLISVPALKVNGALIPNKFDLVDEITGFYQNPATVFQVIPEGLLRISTSVKKDDGSRAVGTYIPKDSTVYETVMKGEIYYGRAFVVNEWYISAYRPIFDKQKNIIGCLFLGRSIQAMVRSLQHLKTIKIGESGFVQIFDSQGRQHFHPESSYIGKIRQTPHHKEMIEKKNGEIFSIQESNVNNKKGVEVFFSYKFFDKLDWIVCTTAYLDEVFKPIDFIRNLLIIGIIIAIALFWINTFILGRMITKPLNVFKDIFSKGAKGDLTSIFPLKQVNCSKVMNCGNQSCSEYGKTGVICFNDVGSSAPEFGKTIQCPKIIKGIYKSCEECSVYHEIVQDEITELGAMYNTFMCDLSNVIGNLKVGSQEISNMTGEMAASSQQSSASIQEINVSTAQVANNMVTQKNKVIQSSENINHILGAIKKIDSMIEQANAQVSDSSTAIEEMAANISSANDMAIQAENVSENLNNISQEGQDAINSLAVSIEEVAKSSRKIVEMVQLIMDISEQTNLLAMNAAIEAAHAGDYGKGFAVVAEEIRQLADKSGQGAKQIQQMVKEIHSNIEKNLNFSEKTKESFGKVKADIVHVARTNQEIAGSMEEQKTANESILKSISQLKQFMNLIVTELNVQANKGQAIEKIMEELKIMSEEITIAMEEEKNGLSESAQAAEALNRISSKLKNIASKTEQDFQHFKIG